ncbi:MAG: CoA transferase, partial [Dehalococcoidia bacterium]
FVCLIGPQILEYTLNGRVPRSIGNRDFSAVQGCYPCMGDDRWLVLTLPDDAAWHGFCRAAGSSACRDDSRFATVTGRLEHHDTIDDLIAAWTRTVSREDAVQRLRAEGLMAGPVLDDADLMQDPHLAERGYFWTIPHAEAGTHRYPGPPYRFRNARLEARYPPVRLGEHNERLYKGLLGVSDEEYTRLTDEGHIGVDYALNIR